MLRRGPQDDPERDARARAQAEATRQRELRRLTGTNVESAWRDKPIKRVVFDWLYAPKTELFIMVMILLSVGLLAVEVLDPSNDAAGWLRGVTHPADRTWFFWIDIGFSIFFVIEYGLKLWVAPRKWYFVRHNLIDLLALLPILRVFRIGRVLRLLRLVRLLRLLRVGQVVHQQVSSFGDDVQRRVSEHLIIVIYLLFSVAFGSLGILVFERGVNPGFTSLGDGLWWCIVTLTTVGYGDLSPVTPGGKVVAGLIMFIGLSFYAMLTGLLSTIIIERSKNQESNKMEIATLTDHVVVCGWNETGRRLVADLIRSPQDPRIVVLYHNTSYPKLIDPNVSYLEADPTTERGLLEARVDQASVAVVLPDQREGRATQDVDARTILTVLAIERLRPELHSIAELLNEENAYHLRNAGCDEVIVSGAYTGTMLSQAVQSPGMSEVFGELFRPGEGAMLREQPLPTPLEGARFSEAAAQLFGASAGVLLGYRRQGALTLSPRDDVTLQAGDRIVLVLGAHTQSR